jgi:hypothetical protein
MHRALESAGIAATDVSKVLLVGGSSRIPLISQMVSSELGRPVAVDADPKHAIALGAAASAGGALAGSGSATDAGAPADALDEPSSGAAGAAAAGAGAVAGAALGAAAATGAAASPANPTLASTEAQPTTPAAPAPPQPTAAPPAYEPTAPMPQTPAAAMPPGGTPAAPAAPTGGPDGDSSKLPLILGVVAAIVILAGGAFFLFGSGGDDSASPVDTADPVSTNAPTSEAGEDSVPGTTAAGEDSVPDTTEPPEVTQPPTIDDASLQANVNAAVAGVTPDVTSTVSAGVATLTGQTDNTTADAAVATAQGVEGVTSVNDAIGRLADDEVCGTDITSADRWACLDSVVFDGTTLRATFAFENADEELNSNGGYHLHFFSDVDEPIDAGTPNGGLSNGTGNWEVWDDPTGYTTDPFATFGAVPTRLCVEIANPTHSIENLASGNCWKVEQMSGFAPAGFAAVRST